MAQQLFIEDQSSSDDYFNGNQIKAQRIYEGHGCIMIGDGRIM